MTVLAHHAQEAVLGQGAVFRRKARHEVWVMRLHQGVQQRAPEIVGGFCLTKDMARGNQLGPYLVTLDEIGNPYALDVSVTVDGQVRYQGSTSEISHKVEDVFAWLGMICPLVPGSVVGMGTIPDCTGLDHDDFIDPGADIAITIDRLGTLRCRFDAPSQKLWPSRWPLRPLLKKYHG